MQFNIANKLDIGFLNRKLDSAYSELRNDFYIFMSPDTLADMPRLDDHEFQFIGTCNHCTGRVGSYQGHKVFGDPSMKYGMEERLTRRSWL